MARRDGKGIERSEEGSEICAICEEKKREKGLKWEFRKGLHVKKRHFELVQIEHVTLVSDVSPVQI